MPASTARHVGAASPVDPSAVVAASAAASEAGAEDEALATCMVTTRARTAPARVIVSVPGQAARSCLCNRFWLQTYVSLFMFGV